MAMSGLVLKQLRQRVIGGLGERSRALNSLNHHRSYAKKSYEGNQIAVSEGKRSRLFPRRQPRGWLWRNRDRALNGLGNALMQATENINRLFENMNYVTPWSLSERVKEKDDHYKVRYDMPGISKEDLKITIDDGVLSIKGEHKEEKEEENEDDEYWVSSSSYGYYNTSLVLPDDAKADEVKAELKDGVLTITIPRDEKAKKDVKHVTIH